MNWKEIFSWYWEQKGVENPERFLSEDDDDENIASEILTMLSGLFAENNNEVVSDTLIEDKLPENIEK